MDELVRLADNASNTMGECVAQSSTSMQQALQSKNTDLCLVRTEISHALFHDRRVKVTAYQNAVRVMKIIAQGLSMQDMANFMDTALRLSGIDQQFFQTNLVRTIIIHLMIIGITQRQAAH